MKAYLLYNRNTPDQRYVEDMGKELEKAQVETELLDADGRDGIGFAEAHDILGRPALALLREDGSPVQIWQGRDDMPSASEVSYRAHQ